MRTSQRPGDGDKSNPKPGEPGPDSAAKPGGTIEKPPRAEPMAAEAPKVLETIAAETGSGRTLGPIGRLMALPEPERTCRLEHAVQAGLTVMLRCRGRKDLRVKHGAHVLVVPVTPKPFTAGHAIHILWYAADQVEEVEE